MKIEKVNDRQIRCTLTKEDLISRQIKISELAYGTDKAKQLFRDMMRQAAFEFGFEAEDIPLMIEAIPLNAESIVLVITKVEDPEELDTRFSKFAPGIQSEAGTEVEDKKPLLDGSEFLSDLLKKIKEGREKLKEKSGNATAEETGEKAEKTAAEETGEKAGVPVSRIFCFTRLGEVIRAARMLTGIYDGENALYKDNYEELFVLVISSEGCSQEIFSKTCNVLNEYGVMEKFVPAARGVLDEHCTLMLADKAIQTLAEI